MPDKKTNKPIGKVRRRSKNMSNSKVLKTIVLIVQEEKFPHSLFRVDDDPFESDKRFNYVAVHLKNPLNKGKYTKLYEYMDQQIKGNKYSEDDKQSQNGKHRFHSNLKKLCREQKIQLIDSIKNGGKNIETYEILEFPDGVAPTLMRNNIVDNTSNNNRSVPHEIQEDYNVQSVPHEKQEYGGIQSIPHEMHESVLQKMIILEDGSVVFLPLEVEDNGNMLRREEEGSIGPVPQEMQGFYSEMGPVAVPDRERSGVNEITQMSSGEASLNNMGSLCFSQEAVDTAMPFEDSVAVPHNRINELNAITQSPGNVDTALNTKVSLNLSGEDAEKVMQFLKVQNIHHSYILENYEASDVGQMSSVEGNNLLAMHENPSVFLMNSQLEELNKSSTLFSEPPGGPTFNDQPLSPSDSFYPFEEPGKQTSITETPPIDFGFRYLDDEDLNLQKIEDMEFEDLPDLGSLLSDGSDFWYCG